ncbi:hypothetical protein SLA2020_009160 [Shorea laevis]
MEIRFLARQLRYIFKDAKAGAPLATLFAQVALFAASFCLRETRLCSEYDHSGLKTAILYHVCSVLPCYTNRLSWLGFFRRGCGIKVNSIANLICMILGILLEKFYEKSLASLCFALAMTILFLILVVIVQPRFFGLLIGVNGSVAYNLFQLKLGTWIVVAICFVLWAFKFWLDKNWLEPKVANKIFSSPVYITSISSRLSNPFPAAVIRSIDALIVAGFYLVWASAFFITNCLNSESCASCSPMEKLKCEAIYVLWLSPAHIHRVYYSLKKSTEIVLDVYLHCEDCASKVAGRLIGFPGVESVETNLAKDEVTVKGIVEPEKLIDFIKKTIRKHAELSTRTS